MARAHEIAGVGEILSRPGTRPAVKRRRPHGAGFIPRMERRRHSRSMAQLVALPILFVYKCERPASTTLRKVRSYGLRRAALPAGLHTSHTSSRSYFSSRREASGDVESPGSERRPFTMPQSSCQGGLGGSRSRVGSRVCYRRCTLSRFTGGVIWSRTVRRGRLLGTPTPRPSSTGLCRSRVGGVSLGRWFVAHAPATLTAVRPPSGWH